ncbi:MAG TPA: hypothetical protein VG166_03890 [Caulobacteraceae bacterium]|jgi:ABC-2 type transport system permease protein|nr:hypothetical protein [Caulobacteraceae bacterium]
MTIASEFAPEVGVRAPAAPRATRPLWFSLRRELWENRSIYIAPAVVAGLVLLGFVIGLGHVPADVQVKTDNRVVFTIAPYGLAWVCITGAGLIVAAFYCLGALHNERRDRSILFWKSMPVSDLATVATKAAVPLAVMPAVVFVLVLAAQLVIWLIAIAIHAANGNAVAALWAQWPMGRMSLMMAWGLFTMSLWYAPVWGWLLMVSAWARRAPFLWAVLPPLGVCVVEGVAFSSGQFAHLLGRRLTGAVDVAFADMPRGEVMPDVSQIDPVRFFTSPETWLGLAFAAAFLAVAVWLRRRKDPT